MTQVLMVDNFDSFTYNLVDYLTTLGCDVTVVRNNAGSVDALLDRGFDAAVISPGPCTPNDAGITLEVARRFPEAGIPTLGVCLGHQAIGQAYGGKVIRHRPVHGKATEIVHDGRTVFRDISQPLRVGRYHSLIVDSELPAELEVSARGDGVIMAIRHRELPVEGVQFHPESILTSEGKAMLTNFLERRA